MAYWLRDMIAITLDGGRIENEAEHDTYRLERMFALMGKVAIGVAKNSEHLRLGLQAVRAIEEISDNAGNLTVTWRAHGDFMSFWPFVEIAWRETAGSAASVTHKINNEVVAPVAPAPGSYGGGSYGSGSYGGVATEELSQRGE